MFGPLRLSRHRHWSATSTSVTTRWTLQVAVWSWQLAHTRPGRRSDQAAFCTWGWE